MHGAHGEKTGALPVPSVPGMPNPMVAGIQGLMDRMRFDGEEALWDSGNQGIGRGFVPDFLSSRFCRDPGFGILNVESRKTGAEERRSGTQGLRESEGGSLLIS